MSNGKHATEMVRGHGDPTPVNERSSVPAQVSVEIKGQWNPEGRVNKQWDGMDSLNSWRTLVCERV